jgi:hypothetical protein
VQKGNKEIICRVSCIEKGYSKKLALSVARTKKQNITQFSPKIAQNVASNNQQSFYLEIRPKSSHSDLIIISTFNKMQLIC